MTGIRIDCTRCALPLDAQNLTGLCRECKQIERDARVGHTAAEVTLDEARVNFVTVFPGYRQRDLSAVYMPGACRGCGQFVARRETGRCEWCSPNRRRPKKRARKATRRKNELA